jgi:hypothetical protein
MLLGNKCTWSEEKINMFDRLFYQLRITPQLRWSLMNQGAGETLALEAGLAVVFE